MITLTDKTRELTLQLNRAREENDREAVSALLHPDVEWHPPASIRPRPFRGRDRVAAALTGGTTGHILDVASIRRDVVQVLADGEVSVVRQLMTARKLDGEDYANDYCWIYTFQDGLVVRMDEYGDSLRTARAGFVPLSPNQPSSDGASA